LLDLPPGRPLPVVVFYGGDGTGKSSLLRQLRADLPPVLPSALLEFGPESGGALCPADYAQALAELRRQLAPIKCPRFDFAYGCLRFRQGVMDEPPLNDLEMVLPSGGLEDRLTEQADREDVFRLRRTSPEEIYSLLAGLFFRDLEEGLPERPGRACRAVFFLDGLEALQTGPCGVRVREGGSWLRDLRRAAPPVLLVLAGRDRLPGEAFAPDDFGGPPDQRQLGGLPERAARELLGRVVTADPALLDAALRVSAEGEAALAAGANVYHAFALGLCLETLRNAPAADPRSFDMAPGDVARLAAGCFLKTLPPSVSEGWLRRLALTPRFDEVAAGAALPPGGDADPKAAWGHACGLSFARAAGEPGWLAFHPRLRRALAGAAACDSLAGDDHRFWRDHWRGRSRGEADAYAALAWHHLYRLDPEAALDEWKGLAASCRRAGRAADHYRLLGWWDSIDGGAADRRSDREADALVEAAAAYRDATLGPRAENLRRAVACYEAALGVYAEAGRPDRWAATQSNLGAAYGALQAGNRAENLRRAVACYEAALRVHTEEGCPSQWAEARNNLGAAYAELPSGDGGENLRRAITCHEAALRVYTEEAYPSQWAEVQNNLGAAYAELPSGDRAGDLWRAIACYEAALDVYAGTGRLDQWAATQNNLGIAYEELPSGDRAENLRRAVTCYEAALGVHTETGYPDQWAATQNNLGSAYAELPSGDRAENLRRAIACYEAALRVYTETGRPSQWAMTQNNRGAAFAELPAGDRAENLRRAVACYEAALRVRTEADYPAQWAAAQNNLGAAYAELPSGDRAENLRRAAAACEAALRVYTEKGYPSQWAEVRNDLEAATAELASGED